eukprot:tig00001542_g9316.t1
MFAAPIVAPRAADARVPGRSAPSCPSTAAASSARLRSSFAGRSVRRSDDRNDATASPVFSVRASASHDKESMNKAFWKFFDAQPGRWFSERTYHYFSPELPQTGEIERSQTDFTVDELDEYVKRRVLEVCNEEVTEEGVEAAAGYKVFFDTVMEKRGRVTNSTNVLFVPVEYDGDVISGKYFRDIAYEEAKPFVGSFTFDCARTELLMKTRYSRITSVDSIILVRDDLRLRKILNFSNPGEGERPTALVLAGFGCEHRKK